MFKIFVENMKAICLLIFIKSIIFYLTWNYGIAPWLEIKTLPFTVTICILIVAGLLKHSLSLESIQLLMSDQNRYLYALAQMKQQEMQGNELIQAALAVENTLKEAGLVEQDENGNLRYTEEKVTQDDENNDKIDKNM